MLMLLAPQMARLGWEFLLVCTLVMLRRMTILILLVLPVVPTVPMLSMLSILPAMVVLSILFGCYQC